MSGIKYLPPNKILPVYNQIGFPIVDTSVNLSQLGVIQDEVTTNQILVDATNTVNNIGKLIVKSFARLDGSLNTVYTIESFTSTQIQTGWKYLIMASLNMSTNVSTTLGISTIQLNGYDSLGAIVSTQQDSFVVLAGQSNFVQQVMFAITGVIGTTYRIRLSVTGTSTAPYAFSLNNPTYYPNSGGDLIRLGV